MGLSGVGDFGLRASWPRMIGTRFVVSELVTNQA